MLCEKPEEKETKATGYTVQERYRSRWLSPISRYSHLCAGGTAGSQGATPRLCSPQVPTHGHGPGHRGSDRGGPGHRGVADPPEGRSGTLDACPVLPRPR